MSSDMAHEMGHSGTDMQAMVSDMRNRFWICLFFTVPIFFYSPMGLFTPPEPPFGIELNVWLFGLEPRHPLPQLAVLCIRVARAHEGHAGHGGVDCP